MSFRLSAKIFGSEYISKTFKFDAHLGRHDASLSQLLNVIFITCSGKHLSLHPLRGLTKLIQDP